MIVTHLLRFLRAMMKNKLIWIFLLYLWQLPIVNSLKITSLDVPKTAWNSVKLNCRYDLEDGKLYAVKWYKNQMEFFRCLANGSVQQFPSKDISIYSTGNSQIGSCFFELTALTAQSGGIYTCEVSLDWPTFQIVSQSATLKIVEPSSDEYTRPTTTEKDATINSSSNFLKSNSISQFIGSAKRSFLIFILCINLYILQ